MARRAHGHPARPRRPGSWRGSPSNLTAPPPTGPPGRHGLLEVPYRGYPAAGRPAPAGGPLGAPVRSTCAPLPGLRPPTARRAPGRRHQAPARALPAPTRHRADPAPASVPCPSSDAFAHLPGALPGDLGPGPHRATRFPCPPRPRDFRGQSHVRHRAPFAGIPDESRRGLARGVIINYDGQ